MKVIPKYIFLALPFLLLACFPPYGRRISLYSNYRAKYPAESYLLGIGTSPLLSDPSLARQRAKEAACREIAEEIRMDIESRITDSYGLGIKPKLEIFHRSTVDMVLEGVRIVEATPLKEKGIYLVVAVLPREEAMQRLSQRVRRKASELNSLMKKASAEGEVLRRLRILSKCEEISLQRAALLEELSAVAGPLPMSSVSSPGLSLVEVEEQIWGILKQLKVLKLGGEGREGNPFQVRVLYGSLPLPEVPLRWSLNPKLGEIKGDERTNEEGVGGAVIKGAELAWQAEARVEIDLNRLMGEETSPRWEKGLNLGVSFPLRTPQFALRGVAEGILQDFTSSGLYGIDILVEGFSPGGKGPADDLTLALKDCLAENLLFQLVESPSSFPYVLRGKVEDLGSKMLIIADLSRRGKAITKASLLIEKSKLRVKK